MVYFLETSFLHQSAKSAVMHNIAGYYQALHEKQEHEYFWNLSALQ
jgi:hypothetical protein